MFASIIYYRQIYFYCNDELKYLPCVPFLTPFLKSTLTVATAGILNDFVSTAVVCTSFAIFLNFDGISLTVICFLGILLLENVSDPALEVDSLEGSLSLSKLLELLQLTNASNLAFSSGI